MKAGSNESALLQARNHSRSENLKKILIITPHFPPSNLAAVHRSRLFAQHLPSFGWKPIILTVDEAYYEEKPDHNLTKLLPSDLQIEKVKAFSVSRPRIVGDIGLRAFFQLYKKAKQLVRKQEIDFVYIPIPSFYSALLGRLLYETCGVPYGIDYIDPWVHSFPGSDIRFSRHWFSSKLARFLEPIAVKKASLITGVAEGYYAGVLQRNPHLIQRASVGAMPYGGERSDHEKLGDLKLASYLFPKKTGKLQLVYAGAMLPKAYEPLGHILQAIKTNAAIFENLEIHFIGTGKTPNDPEGYNIKPLAEKAGLWQNVIFEYPARIPYLDVLAHLGSADGLFILGSTEPHYTPSKVYQGVLSGKPIFAVLHKDSTALQVLQKTRSGYALALDPQRLPDLEKEFVSAYVNFLQFRADFNPDQVDQGEFEKFSAASVTATLTSLCTQAIADR